MPPPPSLAPPRRERAGPTAAAAGLVARHGWECALLLLALVAFWFRLVDLGRLPGINGDEAWYGVQMLRLEAGERVDWRTPTGNLMGPLQPALLFVFQLFAGPSFTVLRLPAVLSGVGAVVLAYVVLRRHFDATTGWIGAALTAALPANIAYSRFGWDVSHSGLVAMTALHFALAGSVPGAALSFAFLLWVHPTNVFTAPFLLMAFAGAERGRATGTRPLARTALLGTLMLGGALGVLAITTSGAGAAIDAAQASQRGRDLAEWWRFTALFGRFLLGDVTHDYVAGTWMGPVPGPRDAFAIALASLLLGLGVLRLRAERISARTGVLAGCLATLATFAVLVGARGVSPHTERYGYCLLVPAVAATSLVLRALGGARRWPGYLVTVVLVILLLWRFERDYLEALRSTGGTSHPTFWTGEVEPKQAAAASILESAGDRRPVRVLAEDWWTYWPLAYLLHQSDGVEVTLYDGRKPERGGGRVYLVGFPGGLLDRWTRDAMPECARTSFGVPGYARDTALQVWEIDAGGCATPRSLERHMARSDARDALDLDRPGVLTRVAAREGTLTASRDGAR